MNKQSSIEHLVNWMSKNEYFIGNDLLKEIEQAKEMHKQEIIHAYNQSWHFRDKPYETAEQYYNEHFAK